ncbi:hypothetical protein SDC9_186724 [bioreactor metagenome]|uniref:Uncharacterized protein n=1 Tax=bioreactor metagenome TaxID=1076179 RepID=A0A645HKR1_9ZZZZ
MEAVAILPVDDCPELFASGTEIPAFDEITLRFGFGIRNLRPFRCCGGCFLKLQVVQVKVSGSAEPTGFERHINSAGGGCLELFLTPAFMLSNRT